MQGEDYTPLTDTEVLLYLHTVQKRPNKCGHIHCMHSSSKAAQARHATTVSAIIANAADDMLLITMLKQQTGAADVYDVFLYNDHCLSKSSNYHVAQLKSIYQLQTCSTLYLALTGILAIVKLLRLVFELIFMCRWWEGRVVWGGLLNITRNIMRQVCVML